MLTPAKEGGCGTSGYWQGEGARLLEGGRGWVKDTVSLRAWKTEEVGGELLSGRREVRGATTAKICTPKGVAAAEKGFPKAVIDRGRDARWLVKGGGRPGSQKVHGPKGKQKELSARGKAAGRGGASAARRPEKAWGIRRDSSTWENKTAPEGGDPLRRWKRNAGSRKTFKRPLRGEDEARERGVRSTLQEGGVPSPWKKCESTQNLERLEDFSCLCSKKSKTRKKTIRRQINTESKKGVKKTLSGRYIVGFRAVPGKGDLG